jgi:hypothetical protein
MSHPSFPNPAPIPAPPTELERVGAIYRQTFGHGVPSHVAQMFTAQPGPLVMEIRQAIALGRPVPAWRTHARLATESPQRSSAYA